MRDKFALRRLTYDYQLCTEDQIAFFISLVSCTLHEFFLSFVLLRRFIVFFTTVILFSYALTSYIFIHFVVTRTYKKHLDIKKRKLK